MKKIENLKIVLFCICAISSILMWIIGYFYSIENLFAITFLYLAGTCFAIIIGLSFIQSKDLFRKKNKRSLIDKTLKLIFILFILFIVISGFYTAYSSLNASQIKIRLVKPHVTYTIDRTDTPRLFYATIYLTFIFALSFISVFISPKYTKWILHF